MRDVLHRPPAPDALPSPGKPGQPVAALPAGIAAEPTSGEFGKLAGQIEQMRRDHTAIVRLIERLPEAERDMLPEVLPTVNGLTERAVEFARTLQAMDRDINDDALASLDARISALEDEGEGTEAERRLDLLKRQRVALEELIGRREKVESKFESCVLAVQNVRFDLLRLKSAGVEQVLGDLTSATQQARALKIDMDAAISAAGEIKAALGKG
jgi:hypothetical protein